MRKEQKDWGLGKSNRETWTWTWDMGHGTRATAMGMSMGKHPQFHIHPPTTASTLVLGNPLGATAFRAPTPRNETTQCGRLCSDLVAQVTGSKHWGAGDNWLQSTWRHVDTGVGREDRGQTGAPRPSAARQLSRCNGGYERIL